LRNNADQVKYFTGTTWHTITYTGVWRTGMSTLPAAPPIKYVLGYRSRTLNPNPTTDPNPNPKNRKKKTTPE